MPPEFPPIHLASTSPRRADLLRQVGLPFRVMKVDAPERKEGAPVQDLVLENARRKARAAADAVDEGWILAADTLGELDGDPLGKPSHEEEAEAMLTRLAGRTHRVVTGVVVLRQPGGTEAAGTETTAVTFPTLPPDQVRAYVDTGEPLGKAGAYAIQGLGAALVEGIEGDYTNVVGLPLPLTVRLLSETGYLLPGHLLGSGR